MTSMFFQYEPFYTKLIWNTHTHMHALLIKLTLKNAAHSQNTNIVRCIIVMMRLATFHTEL